jgi:hypothetical protein
MVSLLLLVVLICFLYIFLNVLWSLSLCIFNVLLFFLVILGIASIVFNLSLCVFSGHLLLMLVNLLLEFVHNLFIFWSAFGSGQHS